MQNRRYHVHIICVAHEQALVLDALAVFFQPRAFLTYDISPKLPQASLYGRQCIDSCDQTVVIIGNSYGITQNLGVSQMHLSYLSAKAKLKPMLVLIKKHDEKERDLSRQLQEFTRLLEQQANHVYYYDDTTHIIQLLGKAYQDMAASCKLVASWVKADKDNSDSLMLQQANALKPAPSTAVFNPSFAIKSSLTETADSQYLSKQNLETDTYNDNNEMFNVLKLSESFTIEYSAQAYEGGNLTDITMTTEVTWQQILNVLAKMPASSSSYGLQSCINRLIATKAEHDIKQKMPNVHAVARCQAKQEDLHKLHRAIILANWVQLTKNSVNTSQQLWTLTAYAKKLFKESGS